MGFLNSMISKTSQKIKGLEREGGMLWALGSGFSEKYCIASALYAGLC